MRKNKKFIATTLNEFVKIEDDIQMEVNWFLVDAFKKSVEIGVLLNMVEEKKFKLQPQNIPSEYRNIVGFEEKMFDFVNEFNKLLETRTYEEMEKADVLGGFIYLTKPFIKKIEYKHE